jgi:F-type H+-transporting ATPase subunit alpha
VFYPIHAWYLQRTCFRFYVFGVITFIAQKCSLVIKIVDLLYWSKVIWLSSIVFASVTESMSLLYMCPITATVICEYLRNLSFSSLLCYDDFSKHAVSYRHLSLALMKPVGREAFPSDIFYLHSRILSISLTLSL